MDKQTDVEIEAKNKEKQIIQDTQDALRTILTSIDKQQPTQLSLTDADAKRLANLIKKKLKQSLV